MFAYSVAWKGGLKSRWYRRFTIYETIIKMTSKKQFYLTFLRIRIYYVGEKEGDRMASYANVVETSIQKYQPNRLIVANELYKTIDQKMLEQTFYKSLERMTKSGKLVHLTKGVYYRPKKSRVGNIPISDEEISAHYLQAGHGVIVGYRMYNKKRLTTQIGKQVEILSNALHEEKKNIQNVSVRKISVELNTETVPIIETLEILQDYRRIEDMNIAAMAAYLKRFAELYSDETADQVLERVKYKKSTIAFMEAILNHLGIRNTLGKYLSSMSDYKIPSLELLYEFA